MQNKHFNLKRFCNALLFDLKLNKNKYLYFILSLILILFLINIYDIYGTAQMIKNYDSIRKFEERDYIPIFYSTMFIGFVITTGTSFPLLRHKKSTIHYLMQPASTLEKFLIQFLIRVISFAFLFTPIFWLEFKFAAYLYNLYAEQSILIENFDLFTPFTFLNNNKFNGLVICFLISIATFLFTCGTHFKKKVFPKSIFSLVLFILLLLVFLMIGTSIFYPEKFQFQNSLIYFNNYRISKEIFFAHIFLYVLSIIVIMFSIPLAYFKLREKEL